MFAGAQLLTCHLQKRVAETTATEALPAASTAMLATAAQAAAELPCDPQQPAQPGVALLTCRYSRGCCVPVKKSVGRSPLLGASDVSCRPPPCTGGNENRCDSLAGVAQRILVGVLASRKRAASRRLQKDYRRAALHVPDAACIASNTACISHRQPRRGPFRHHCVVHSDTAAAPAANLQHLQPAAILRTSRKLVSSEKRPLVVMPSQVPPRRRSLPASTWGCCSQKWAGAVGLHEQPCCEHLVDAMGNAWTPCGTLRRTRHG